MTNVTTKTIQDGLAEVFADGHSIGQVERYEHFTGRQDQNGIPETHTAWAGITGEAVAFGIQQDRISHATTWDHRTRAAAARALADDLGR